MKNFRKTFLPITTFVPMDIKRQSRDKVVLFFTFIFPLLFLAIFGSIFSGNDSVSFRVALLNQSESETATLLADEIAKNDLFQVDEEATQKELAQEKMSRGQLDAMIILPDNFGAVGEDLAYPSGDIQVLYNQSNETAGQTLGSVLNSILNDINSQFVDTSVPFTATTESTAIAGSTRFDYTFSGILGFTMLTLGIFGPTAVFPRLKQAGVLRRYKVTSLKVWQYFTANVISNAIIGLLSLIVMFVVSVLLFNLNMRGSYVTLGIVVLLGTVLMYGIGLAIGGWAKNEHQAAPVTQMVSIPMMFLSGVFFPVFLMPELLQAVTRFIPLTPIINSVRLVVTENASLFDLGSELSIILVWTVVIYVIAFKVYRWE
jgi:ABC-2 type transport system permease protein